MSAGRYNILIEQGSRFRRTLTWKPGGKLGDLTGFTARMKIRDNDTDEVLVSLTTAPTANGDVLTLGGAASTIDIYISGTTTAALNFVVGRYDLELVDTLGEPERLIEGQVKFRREVTY